MLNTATQKNSAKIGIPAIALLVVGALAGWFGMQFADQSGRLLSVWALITPEGDDDLFAEDDGFGTGDLDPQMVLALIDELAAHPDDPLKPASVVGVTDDEIAGLHLDDVEFMLSDGLKFAREALPESPRYLFEVARVALFNDQQEVAIELLLEAAEAGSAAAAGYLGWMAEDDATAIEWLEASAQAGFAPAQALLEEMGASGSGGATPNNLTQTTPAQPVGQVVERFIRSDLLKAMVEKDYAYLRANRTEAIHYMLILNQGLADPAAWMKAGSPTYSLDLNPRLMPHLEITASTDMQYLGDMSGKIMNAGVNAGGAWLNERQSQVNSGTMDPLAEVAALLGGIVQGTSGFRYLSAEAAKDAERLVLLHGEDTAAFKEIYNAMADYALTGL